MDAGGDRALQSTNVEIIREIYDSQLSPLNFSEQLEKALENKKSIIVIEPSELGNETATWICFGNWLHKTAVISGISSIFTGFIWCDDFTPQAPLSILSLFCTGLYTASWQFDNCVKYQVERDPRKLIRLPILGALTASCPVVLVRKDDTKRKILHCTVTVTAAALCIYRLYFAVK